MSIKKTVLAFGEILWDILPDQTILGGAPFNFTHRIHSLGHTGLMVSRLGNDPNGEAAMKRIKDLDMPLDFVQKDPEHPTGTVHVFFDADHNPDYEIIANVAYDFVESTPSLMAAASAADCLCFGTLAQRSPVSRHTVRALLEVSNAIKFLDVNLRKNCYDNESIRYSLGQADVLKLNADEAMTIAGILNFPFHSIQSFCGTMIENWNLSYCIVTLDARGAYAVSDRGESMYEPGYKIRLQDSLGSGDAFSAGFVHKMLQGDSVGEAVFFGNILGAIVATQAGATRAVSENIITTFLKTNYDRLKHPDLG